ncbi:CitMHS family transporter [Enterococcus casseliflavus]|uniref:CitMHS family transporter n=1 Tax=Enterococcus casseliflavus TaxID=37734 RepID=UPI001883D6C8|nr:citrate:proton symporter [Enterococcus casseliflavus]MBE9909413.1 citrate transporter [Enterococcus casseliflavus]
MILTILAYLMIIVFMVAILKKWLSPFTSLVLVPLVFTLVAILAGVSNEGNIGEFFLEGIATTSNTGIMLLFAILYFSIMLDAGLFDPVTAKMIHFAKGDPMKVLVATAVVSAAVSLNGDGTTTTLICCSAFIPIYKKLNMKLMNLAVLVILQNTIMNLLPWGGPTARAMAVLEVDASILSYLAPGMVLSIIYVIVWVAPRMGRQERKRLGITQISDDEINQMIAITDLDILAIRRPKKFIANSILTIALIAWLVAGSFIEKIYVSPLLLFLVGTCLALILNYPKLKDQSARIGANGGDAVQTVILVFAAGVFMGLFQGSGMADALAQSFVTIVPKQLAEYWGIVIAVISAPGTFFISNDGFYLGVMPVLAEAGRAYGFTNMQMAIASLMGQAFHLLSPLVAFIYLLVRLTGVDMGQWQKEAGKYALGVFLIFIISSILLGYLPFRIS